MFRGWTVSFAEERNVWWSRFRIENDCQASFTLNMIRENIYTENKDCKYAKERKSTGELQRQIVLIWRKKKDINQMQVLGGMICLNKTYTNCRNLHWFICQNFPCMAESGVIQPALRKSMQHPVCDFFNTV